MQKHHHLLRLTPKKHQLVITTQRTPATLSPNPKEKYPDRSNNNPPSGGKVYLINHLNSPGNSLTGKPEGENIYLYAGSTPIQT